MADTHINAYYADLATAEAELTQAQGKVAGLKEQIAIMEADNAEDAPVAPAPGDVVTPTQAPSEADLNKLNRPELESAAEDAGVENPSDKEVFPNKAGLVDATTQAQADQAPVDAPVETPADEATEEATEPTEPTVPEVPTVSSDSGIAVGAAPAQEAPVPTEPSQSTAPVEPTL